jgi:hypothetical protein
MTQGHEYDARGHYGQLRVVPHFDYVNTIISSLFNTFLPELDSHSNGLNNCIRMS